MFDIREFDYSRIQDQSRKGRAEACFFCGSDHQRRKDRKTGKQLRQSQQAYERGVQESETFGGDAEVCHSESEGVNVRHTTVNEENL